MRRRRSAHEIHRVALLWASGGQCWWRREESLELAPVEQAFATPACAFPYYTSLSLMMAPEMIPIEGEGQRKRVVSSIYIFDLPVPRLTVFPS